MAETVVRNGREHQLRNLDTEPLTEEESTLQDKMEEKYRRDTEADRAIGIGIDGLKRHSHRSGNIRALQDITYDGATNTNQF